MVWFDIEARGTKIVLHGKILNRAKSKIIFVWCDLESYHAEIFVFGAIQNLTIQKYF